MANKADLLHEFDTSRERMRAALDGANPGLEIYPGWGLKELVAHLTRWDDATIVALREHSRGKTPPLLAMRGPPTENRLAMLRLCNSGDLS